MEEEHVEDGRAGVIYQEFDVGRSLALSLHLCCIFFGGSVAVSSFQEWSDGGVPLPQQSGSLCIIAR